MNKDTKAYNAKLEPEDAKICDTLARVIDKVLPEAENKIWHAHPVWFLDGNPVVGYSKLKGAVRLLFWSGATFEQDGLVNIGKFKSAEKRYETAKEIDKAELTRWIELSRDIQWDYKNIVKRRGRLERLK